jgi:signal transduction histidine kinase/CheY-like chemotaxis protein
VSKAEILCFVFNIAERKRASDLIRQTRQLLDLALHFGDVHVWYFTDTCDGHRLVLTIDAESSPFVEMDWGTLEHNVIAEYQQSVVKAFRTSLDSGSPLELEVPFFFDTIRWLLLRGMVWEDGGRRQLVGVYFDLTDIKEAANEMARQKAVAEEASLAKSTFLANMSHEIRTPLNGICGLLEIIKTSELPPEQTDLISCIQKSFSDLLELLNDTLDLAKLESGKLIPLSVSFNPHDVLLSIHESVFTYKRNEPNVYFHIVTSPKEPLLYRGDPHCMMRIVTNLLSNACKNTKHGFITVYISSKDERLFVFAVKDTGCGMTPEVLESIRGHIRHGKTMAVYENTRVGVGLSLVTEMVRLHSGTVRIESEVDVGTTVTVEMPWEPIYYPWFKHRLPTPVRTVMYGRESEVSAMILEYAEFYGQKCRCLKQLDEALTAPSDLLLIGVSADGKEYHWLKEQLERGCFRGTVIACLTAVRPPSLGRPVELFTRPLNPELLRRYFIKIAFGKVNDKSHFHRPVDMMPTNLGLHVLAADDNATNQLVMRQVLKKLGCTFEVVSSGLEALAAIEKTKFDLVLMDQHMPEMDGLEATRRIRRMPGDMAAVPIIAMTASILREDEEACWKAGMTAFLCKPVTLKQLAKMIECVMTGKKGLRPENFL